VTKIDQKLEKRKLQYLEHDQVLTFADTLLKHYVVSHLRKSVDRPADWSNPIE